MTSFGDSESDKKVQGNVRMEPEDTNGAQTELYEIFQSCYSLFVQ